MVKAMVAAIENPESLRYLKKYIEPMIGVEDGARIRTSTPLFGKNSIVTVQDWTVIDGKYCAVVSANEMKETIPISKICKFLDPDHKLTNKGLTYEQNIAVNLNGAGLMQGMGAGCVDGWDCSVQSANGTVFGIEIKYSTHCQLGQGVLHYDSGRWYVSDKFRARAPNFANSVENATIDNVPFLEHVSERVSGPVKNEIKHGVSMYSDEMDFTPALGYLRDKNVDILHIGGKGTYRVQDALPELPLPNGRCKIRVRGKHNNSLTVQCVIVTLIPSHSTWDMLKPEEIETIKQRFLGYEQSNGRSQSEEILPRPDRGWNWLD